jgi:short-subunit dehydrogenase
MNPEPLNPNPSTQAPKHPRTALITGASTGIGEAFTEVFASHGFDLVITARREDRLRAVAERIERAHGVTVTVIPADLASPDGAAALGAEIDRRGIVVDALVNNAGYGVPGGYTRSPWERHEAFLHVMVVAGCNLVHHFLPGMIDRRNGLIINVASLAGLVPAPAGHTLYAASKAFLVRFSEALSHEARPYGVHVTALCPGFTLSEFHDVTGTRATVSKMPSFVWMDAASVAREGYDAAIAGKSVHVTGRVNRTIALLTRLLPQRLVVAANRRASRRYRQV